MVELIPEAEESIEKKKAEFGEAQWSELVRRLSLQMIDILWVEHLEVMQAARSSVNLRAYGQRDPLIEYRKEGMRLFKEMQEVVLHRIAEVIPQLQPEALAKEEEELTKARLQAQSTGGDAEIQRDQTTPRTTAQEFGRNELVTISNGTETKEIKFKKAESFLNSGEWNLVRKK